MRRPWPRSSRSAGSRAPRSIASVLESPSQLCFLTPGARPMPARFRIRLGLLLVGFAAPMVLMAGQAPEVPSFARDVPSIRSGEPIFQFNGKDLTGFYTYLRGHGRDDPYKVFTVRDGMICVSGQ